METGVIRRNALFYGVVDSERRYEPCQLPLHPRRTGTFFFCLCWALLSSAIVQCARASDILVLAKDLVLV